MNRRHFHQAGGAVAAVWLLGAWQHAQALSLASLSNADASSAVKTALSRGVDTAVSLLGRPNGFLGNPALRIGLPGPLGDAAKLMRRLGQGQRVDEVETSLNRAAEAAVPMGRDLLVQAVQTMTVNDAKGILAGGETSVTDFFAQRTRSPLSTRFLPIVDQATQKVGLVQQYNQLAGKAAGLGLLRAEDANLPQYVTGKTLDGLYATIGEQERAMRRDPVGTGSALLQKVFGGTR